MRGALVLATIFTFALPPQCAKLMAKRGDAAGGTPSADTAPPPPPPPPATAPPVFQPPPPVLPADTAPVTSATTAPAASGPDFAKAKAAAEAKDYKKVKSLLEKRVKSGKGSVEEAQLLADACRATKDKACAEAIAKAYPTLPP